jgi:hypothetical protein
MYFKIAILQTSRFETAKPSGLLRGVLIKKASALIYIYIYIYMVELKKEIPSISLT